jgi:hypothetical protein
VRASSSEYDTAAARVRAIELLKSKPKDSDLVAQATDPAATHGQRLAAALALGFVWELKAERNKFGNVVVGDRDLIKFGQANHDNELGNAVLAPIARVLAETNRQGQKDGEINEIRLKVGNAPLEFFFSVKRTGEPRVD